ncbi:hypothetical protein [Nitrogeniibacter aestuarii]|uniref:hypothetical protein n=1 Tax=Nitrogeniibacter aestuarii TaxID=2815343 RepID=UPI001E47282F|nr:hypothetical protein [Nitrogeniibacter aestuarii]
MTSTTASAAKRAKNTPKRRALIAQLLFQLDQLSATNSHHEFEHICRHLARETITPNILPATGPVTAGGDEGRDFETFTTFIRRVETRSSLFRGIGESKPLVFACSITGKSRIKAKVRDDLAKICARETPYIVYFFSNQNIPIATRLVLAQECVDTYGCRLEILDAQAMAEQFTEPALFWIAEEYLHIPSDLLPEPQVAPKSAYADARRRWLEETQTPYTFADFVSIKYGLRAATFQPEYKADLTRWLAVMEQLITPEQRESLVRRVQYEICVATLRGLHDLRPCEPMVHAYLADWHRWTRPAELRDSALLLSYASSAVLHREFDADPAVLHGYSTEIVAFVDAEIAASSDNPNRLADLLYTRSSLASLPFLTGAEPQFDLDAPIKFWFKLLKVADAAPLFELESFVDGLTKLTPILSSHPQFDRLVRRTDEVLEKRTSGFVVAEKCRDRAIALIEQGDILSGMSELHRVKVKWFTGDTLRPTVLAMLLLSGAYRRLGLLWAAKYYAFGAAFLVHTSEDDDLRPLFVGALHEAAACNYEAGEWMSFSELMPLILSSHYEFLNDPDNWEEHERLQATVYHFFVARALSKALNGESAMALLNAPLAAVSMPEDLAKDLLIPLTDLTKFETSSAAQLRDEMQREFFGVPLSDTGPTRIYAWAALGIQWRVTCPNSYGTICLVEQFVAILQIALADLAQRDLCLLPTSVSIQVELSAIRRARVEMLPGNDSSGMKVTLPKVNAVSQAELEEMQQDVSSIALAVLTQCSCLSDKDLFRRLDSAFRDGLTSKVFIVRPYSELFAQFVDPAEYEGRRAASLAPPDASAYIIRSAPELAWLDTPGPGYTPEKAQIALRNRYERGVKPIATTLARLRGNPRFQEWVALHRAEGHKDWWILLVLMNTILNYRARLAVKPNDVQGYRQYISKVLHEEESADTVEFPVETLFSEEAKMSATSFMMTTANVWNLTVRSRTPDINALEKLLGTRYGQATDDVEHIDPFSKDQSE